MLSLKNEKYNLVKKHGNNLYVFYNQVKTKQKKKGNNLLPLLKSKAPLNLMCTPKDL